MSLKQQTFDVPEKDPWKEKDRLKGLYHGDDLNQTEIAEHFTENGYEVSPATISYWMGKLEIETTHSKYGEKRNEGEPQDCVNYDDCGNKAPGVTNIICDNCLDAARDRDSY